MSKPGGTTAMISSTALDLPEHRKQVENACLRAGVFPIGMEQLPAQDLTGVQASLRMVDDADIYIGIYAWRYGWIPDLPGVPNPDKISITEMEFNHAVERQKAGKLKEILIFVMDDDHPIRARDKEDGAEAQEKLRKFKEGASVGRVRRDFGSAEALKTHVLQSLQDALSRLKETETTGKPAKLELHRFNLIPQAPERYIAHPYTLLQTKDVVGRKEELRLLTDWVTKNEVVPKETRVLSVVAIGGMGKSALTWKWFQDIAPNELPNLAGRMWWSFYESDAYFENFVIRALAYAAGMTEEEVRKMTAPDREELLFQRLDEKPFLLVLDGLERILLAYARMDAAHLDDDDLDQRTANAMADHYGLSDDIKETYLEKHRLRQCADLRAGQFLRRLSQVRESRILISTRLYPAELQTLTANPLYGCFALFLNGLEDDDALALWRGFIGGERSGTSEELLKVFNAFGNYPLLLRALAGEVREYRPAPGNFDQWRKENPTFNPVGLPLKNAKTHVLEFALRGLDEARRRVLHTIAAFRMPATWETLCAILVASPDEPAEPKPCATQAALDAVLTELEDRGLVGWDRAANRYDLHPIVRGVVWAALGPQARQDIHETLHTFFDAAPRPPEWQKVESLEDLTPAIELYHTLIGMQRYDDAYLVFRDHLRKATHFRLGASRLRRELLEAFFPEGPSGASRLTVARQQAMALNDLAMAYDLTGGPGLAAGYYQACADSDEREGDEANFAIVLCNLSPAQSAAGQLGAAETSGLRALAICREQANAFQESVSLQWISLVHSLRDSSPISATPMRRSLRIWTKIKDQQSEGFVCAELSQYCLRQGQPGNALRFASRAWELAGIQRLEHDIIRAARAQGEAWLAQGESAKAEERLQHTLTRARAVHMVEEELPAGIALAELRRQQGRVAEARELLEHVWPAAERGPYTIRHADAKNLLARMEREAGNTGAAIAAATEAYRLAWCDGPPYAYHWGLEKARAMLKELGAPEPVMPAFDESKFPPLPEVEINPKDEYWVDPEAGEEWIEEYLK